MVEYNHSITGTSEHLEDFTDLFYANKTVSSQKELYQEKGIQSHIHSPLNEANKTK